jgi:anaerobic ribonucleoside-triphosphate reductase activating protein
MTLDDTFLPKDTMLPPRRPGIVQMAAFQERSTVAGPGQRAVVWVAGCLRRCPGCIKPEHFTFDTGEAVPVVDLANRILGIRDIDGVTYSGGEPFEQATALGELSQRLQTAGLSVVSYSGYRIEALQAQPERFGSLLEVIDLLIDGEYRRELPGPFRWRGSANQRFHVLTARGQIPADPEEAVREVQCAISVEGMRLTGFPSQEMERRLQEELTARGVLIKRVPG